MLASTKTFSIPDSQKDEIEKNLKELRARDLWSESRLICEAIREYAQRHLPGNPQLPLTNFNGQEPFSVAAQEKLEGAKKCEACNGQGWFYES